MGCAAFGIWVFYGWQLIQKFRGISPLFGCLQFSPTAISGFIAAFTTGLILQNLPASVVMMISAALHSRHSLCHHAYQTELLGAAVCDNISNALANVSYFMIYFGLVSALTDCDQ